jgi:hypothetical protein
MVFLLLFYCSLTIFATDSDTFRSKGWRDKQPCVRRKGKAKVRHVSAEKFLGPLNLLSHAGDLLGKTDKVPVPAKMEKASS